MVRGQDGRVLRLFCEVILFWTTEDSWRSSLRSAWERRPAEVFPVVAVVTYEVRDLAEGLVCDGVLEWHDRDGVVEMEMDGVGCV